MARITKLSKWGVLLLALVGLLSGCLAGQSSYNDGNKSLVHGNYDQAVIEYLTAVEESPQKNEYRLKLHFAKNKAALKHLNKGDSYFEQVRYAEALQEYQLSADLDGSLFSAVEGVQQSKLHLQVESLIREAEQLVKANREGEAKKLLENALTLLPEHQQATELKSEIKQGLFAMVDGVELEVLSMRPISLNFQKTTLPDVFEILANLSGINFILDEDVRDTKTTLFLENATFAQALELLLRMNKLDKKILNSKTIILYPKTREKQKQFEDQMIKTFYLSHMEAKKAVNMLRTMLQVRKIFVQEDLNAIVVRDHPDVIKLASRMLEATDRGSSEVVFDLELIEVNHSDTRELGVKLSNYSIGSGLSIPGSNLFVNSGLVAGGSTTNLLSSGEQLNPFTTNLDSFYSIPTATFRFLKTEVDAEVLANPKIRVKNKEKAKVHVGSREPVVTLSYNGDQTIENVQYLDVGVKLEVEPEVQLDNTIVTKLGLEVSNVSGREKTGEGTILITVSSTNANTTLTLKDGEQTVIGGLIRDDSSLTKSKIPFLGDIPFLGEIFNGRDSTKTKREILLSITPHIVKSVQVPQVDIASLWSGNEDELKFGRIFGTFADEFIDVTGVAPVSDSSEVKDKKGIPVDDLVETKSDPEVGQEGAEPSQIVEEDLTLKPEQNYKPITFINSPKQVAQKDELTLDVILGSIKDITSATLEVTYDPVFLQYIQAEEGTLFRQEDEAVSLDVRQAEKPGRLLIDIERLSKKTGVTGGGSLVLLKFKPLGEGDVRVSTKNVYLETIQEQTLKAVASGTTIEIVP